MWPIVAGTECAAPGLCLAVEYRSRQVSHIDKLCTFVEEPNARFGRASNPDCDRPAGRIDIPSRIFPSGATPKSDEQVGVVRANTARLGPTTPDEIEPHECPQWVETGSLPIRANGLGSAETCHSHVEFSARDAKEPSLAWPKAGEFRKTSALLPIIAGLLADVPPAQRSLT